MAAKSGSGDARRSKGSRTKRFRNSSVAESDPQPNGTKASFQFGAALAALGPMAIAHDISWVTEQMAIGSCIRDAAKMDEASRQGITHILNLSRFD